MGVWNRPQFMASSRPRAVSLLPCLGSSMPPVTDLFAWQAGADLDYRIGQVNLGLGARWQDTVNKTVSTGREGADNWLVQAKVGVAF